MSEYRIMWIVSNVPGSKHCHEGKAGVEEAQGVGHQPPLVGQVQQALKEPRRRKRTPQDGQHRQGKAQVALEVEADVDERQDDNGNEAVTEHGAHTVHVNACQQKKKSKK